MRDRVNVPMDPKIKQLFLDTIEVHGKSWTEILEKAVIDLVMEVDPVRALKFIIKNEDEKQEERRQMLFRTEVTIGKLQKKEIDINIAKEKEEQQQNERLKIFGGELEVLNRQWKKGFVNWQRFVDLGKFNNEKEAKKWLNKTLQARGLIPKSHSYV